MLRRALEGFHLPIPDERLNDVQELEERKNILGNNAMNVLNTISLKRQLQ
jgi:hypothetical protein